MRTTEKENRILNMAKILIERDGVFSFKLSDLSRLSGVSRPTLYSHVRSKEDIFIRLYTRHLEFARNNLVTIINTDYLNNREKLFAYYVGSSYFMSSKFDSIGMLTIARNQSVENAASHESVMLMREQKRALNSVVNQLWEGAQSDIEDSYMYLESIIATANAVECGFKFSQAISLKDVFISFALLFANIRWERQLICDNEKVEDYISNLYAWD
ncbi:TetR/AcrR family transcriptional regulator [Vibrio parahaemolyticus]|uniref:TetR/AcrR family transcriptional regulator n=1 Tax=Vibrio parahaemolyticus TaxID=670 RepID=UPI0024BC1DC3|nr:TetR/AcrR family transcriptional regulator [Vibrio parahaemolyticus]EGQ8194989.1 TetR/AcrR family transcriptional regulator [Vibrio parahaemolyticus]WHT02200.1 TetR/AcrR family transcriptional regulator [Vibrio parahaemolyticus]